MTPPELGKGQVRINVHACGVNFPNILIMQGMYQALPELPFAPGGEVAGVVTEVADDASHVTVGQKVMATTFWGGMVEEAVVSQQVIVPIPNEMDFLTAAYYALKQRGRLQPGGALLVAGHRRRSTVQWGKAMGA